MISFKRKILNFGEHISTFTEEMISGLGFASK